MVKKSEFIRIFKCKFVSFSSGDIERSYCSYSREFCQNFRRVKGVPKIVRSTRDSEFKRTILGGSRATIFRSLVFLTLLHLYIYTSVVLQRHVCIPRSTATLPAGVVCGKALLAPRVPQLNSQAFRLIYRPEVEATLPCALRLVLSPFPSSPTLKGSPGNRQRSEHFTLLLCFSGWQYHLSISPVNANIRFSLSATLRFVASKIFLFNFIDIWTSVNCTKKLLYILDIIIGF